MHKKSGFHRLAFLSTLLLFLAVVPGAGSAHGQERPDKTGILLVAFGTSHPEAQAAFDNIDKAVKAAFPGVDVRWAYTSIIIRHKLAKEGRKLDSVAEALARMTDERFTRVAVQSLHTIPGAEYHDLVQTVHAFARLPGGIKSILVGHPLMAANDDILRTVDAILANVPKERKENEAVILMGHGAHHPGNAFYPAAQYYFWKKDPNVFVGTVEGGPSLDDVLADLKKKGIRKAYLMPFMSVAGEHARNDMAGDEEDSWKSVLTRAGVACVPVLKGTAEYDEVTAIWVDHLKAAMDRLK